MDEEQIKKYLSLRLEHFKNDILDITKNINWAYDLEYDDDGYVYYKTGDSAPYEFNHFIFGLNYLKDYLDGK